MELDIHPLTPALLNDYLHFFDHVAFTDHPRWAQCYCIHFHWQPKWDDEPPKDNRDRIIEHINAGAVQGYLAYSGGNVVGWCNANDKQNYVALKYNVMPELWEENEGEKIKSVVCFLVAPDMRGQGIATRLLERVCADAQSDGYQFVEGYPASGSFEQYAAHHGTVALFEKCGFIRHKEFKRDAVMRKAVGGQP